MHTIYATGIVRNGRVELELPISWPEGTEVIVTPNSHEAVESIEQAEFSRLAAITPSDDVLRLIAVSPPREWLEEDEHP